LLGQGANVLISDTGFDGLIIKLSLCQMSHQDYDDAFGLLTASAGCALEHVISYMFDTAGYIGLEEFSGIPSSIGGALFINLHYFEFLIEFFVFRATVYNIDRGTIDIVDNKWFEFGYDDSKLKRNRCFILLDATFKLKKATCEEIAFAKGRNVEIIRHRKSRFPYQKTCGCFFKNFSPDDVGLVANNEGKKIVAAAYYIDQLGLKGILQKGHSFISSKHANMITHDGEGTASEIIEIAKMMQKEVFKSFGLFLEPECELIGFLDYPLYTKEVLIEMKQ
jgi:UDP-N-acetylmuramate dehydrogenase